LRSVDADDALDEPVPPAQAAVNSRLCRGKCGSDDMDDALLVCFHGFPFDGDGRFIQC
jgi:hypothetical protein